MNKEKMMAVAEKMGELAESIKALCAEAEEEKTEKPEPEGKAEAKAEEKKYTMEDVRKALAAKSSAGFTAQVRELLKSHGATKLSGIAESEYAAIMKEAEGIG